MNDAACHVFQDLINLSVRMMPIFLCLEPKQKNRETIAACSVYLWAIMIFTQSLFHIPDHIFWIFQGFFHACFSCASGLFPRFCCRKAVFLSVGMDAGGPFLISESLYSLVLPHMAPSVRRTALHTHFPDQCLALLPVCAFLAEETRRQIFGSLSARFCLLVAAYPALFLFIQLIGERALFPYGIPSGQSQSLLLFFLVLCVSLLLLYVLTLNSTCPDRKTQADRGRADLCPQMISKQREHYNQTLDYIEQVRIIRHDFRHHIHALLYMDKEQQVKYLKNLQKELETSEQKIFCENQAVNGLIQEYAVRAEKAGISFTARLDLSAHIPIDDLTLCIVIGNLLENAMEASKKMEKDSFIRIQARMDGDHLLMLVENAYNGSIQEKNGNILSSKKDGGSGC